MTTTTECGYEQEAQRAAERQAAHPGGTVRLLERPEGDEPGLVEIVTAGGSQHYWLYPDRTAPGGYQLQGRRSDACYHVVAARDPALCDCDCPDAEYRRRPCKHMLAVRAAALAHGLPVREGGAR